MQSSDLHLVLVLALWMGFLAFRFVLLSIIDFIIIIIIFEYFENSFWVKGFCSFLF